MFEYYEHIRRRHALPVLPIALYLRVGLDGIGWDSYAETFWENELVRFRYPYVGLPALDGAQYVGSNNWLGVALAALMSVPKERRVEVAREAWRRLVQSPLDEYRRFLLCECVDNYSPLEPAQRQALETALLSDPEPEVRLMSIGLLEKWREQGMQQGMQQGQKKMLLTQLAARFGPLAQQVRDRVDQLSPETMDALAVALLTAKSLAELGLEEPRP